MVNIIEKEKKTFQTSNFYRLRGVFFVVIDGFIKENRIQNIMIKEI